MEAAVESVKGGKGLREASRLYNVPVESLRRRVTGMVEMDCRPGPATVLTKSEEDEIVQYLIQMADMGYGMTREAVMHVVYLYVEKCKRSHPFKNEKAGRWWFQGFKARHPNLTVRMPQALSHCRALCSNKETISDFFGKLGALYGKLNLMSKPMQVYNADETGVTIVHKPSKVVAELGRRNVYCVTSAERGKTHTVLSCVSASGHVLPPCIVYPRKRKVPDNFREGAVPGTLFAHSDSGWMNCDIYLEWFEFFLRNIPPKRPVVLIQDGHASHMSIKLIELARANDIHLLCLPAHTTHILQPLDVGVFKPFKTYFSKACTSYLAKHPGRVITNDMIASLVATTWADTFSPNNIMGGFRKTGVFPINPGVIDDKMLSPSLAFQQKVEKPTSKKGIPQSEPIREPEILEKTSTDCSLFTPEKQRLYEKRYEEGYDVHDPEYEVWLRITHPIDARSEPRSDASVQSTSSPSSSLLYSAPTCVHSSSGSSDVLREMLVLPQPKERSQKRKKALNSKAVCITNSEVLEELKAQEAAKLEEEQKKERRKIERGEKKQNVVLEEKKKKGNISKKQEKEQPKRDSKTRPKAVLQTTATYTKERKLEELVQNLTIDSDNENSHSDEEEERAICPLCGLVYPDDGGFWICCDGCDDWFDLKCTDIKSKRHIPDVYFCEKCRV